MAILTITPIMIFLEFVIMFSVFFYLKKKHYPGIFKSNRSNRVVPFNQTNVHLNILQRR